MPASGLSDADLRTYQQRSQMECYHLKRLIEKPGLLRSLKARIAGRRASLPRKALA